MNGWIIREMGINVDTVEDSIQNAFLTEIDGNNTLKIKIAISSINASSGNVANSAMAVSEPGEHISVTAAFENVSERNITLDVFNTDDETRKIILDDLSELSVPGTRFDRPPLTHHN